MLNFSSELKIKLKEQHIQMWNLKGNVAELYVLCRVINRKLDRSWYLISQDPKDIDFLYGIVEEGNLMIKSLSLTHLESISIDGVKCELDSAFLPIKVRELFYQANR